jgi:toluene monooxygenase system ferredoxin subunit
MTRHRVAAIADLWNGDLVQVVAGTTKLVLAKIDDTIHAYADRCPHLGSELSRGILDGKVLTCAAHHWEYDVATGEGINPKHVCLVRFAVAIVDGSVYVEVP